LSLFCHQIGGNFLKIAGIITEYNPLHRGHLLQLERTRELLGADTAVICAMSGSFVQRGDFALLRKHARAEAAVRSGADLVLELPLPWATASAEGFADGGVETLAATGLVTHLSFGSECGDAAALAEIAAVLDSPAYRDALRRRLESGASYAACRQAAAEELLGADRAALLAQPNNNLGVEYCRAILRQNCDITPVSILRQGAAHDGETVDGIASASAIREAVRRGHRDGALTLMAPAMAEIFLREEAARRAPVLAERCERAVLARLRTMTDEEFDALDEGGEGLVNRFRAAARSAATLAELLDAVKTKRYAYARLRRMALRAYLGIPARLPESVPYLRVLAANERGRALLRQMRETARLPVITKPAEARRLTGEAKRIFELEARATDLYTLAYPTPDAAGAEWRESPVML